MSIEHREYECVKCGKKYIGPVHESTGAEGIPADWCFTCVEEEEQSPYTPDSSEPKDDPSTPVPAAITFRQRLEEAVNCCSKENGSNTPDHILAEFLEGCLDAFDRAVVSRSRWYGRHDVPGTGFINPNDSPPSPCPPWIPAPDSSEPAKIVAHDPILSVEPLYPNMDAAVESASVRADIGLTDDGTLPERPVYPTYPTREAAAAAMGLKPEDIIFIDKEKFDKDFLEEMENPQPGRIIRESRSYPPKSPTSDSLDAAVMTPFVRELLGHPPGGVFPPLTDFPKDKIEVVLDDARRTITEYLPQSRMREKALDRLTEALHWAREALVR